MQQKKLLKLKTSFEKLHADYGTDFLKSDPVWFVHQYSYPLDQELVAFLASALAYGSVPQIFKILSQLLKILGPRPSKFLLNDFFKQSPEFLKGLYYRFHQDSDLYELLKILAELYRKEGSLANSFRTHFFQADSDLERALSQWSKKILKGVRAKSPVRFFFASPHAGSACKRLNLFLRWMVRGPNGVDLGLWDFIPLSKLIIPLDTHIYRISYQLGLTRRKSLDWKTAQEITQKLLILDSQDPVKYDFSLTRLGILKHKSSILKMLATQSKVGR